MHRVILAFLILAFGGRSASARDIAFVLGNDDYRDIPRLEKAVNDARAVASALAKAGFAVKEAENLDQRTFSQALVAFDSEVKPGDRAVFYFSGHGVALGGTNYLLPTDVPQPKAGQVEIIRDAAFPVDRVVDGLRDHGAQVAILLLDACRDDPFGPATRGVGLTRGLARVEPPEGVFVLTSAGPRQAALDRLSDADPDPNSVFTRVFLKELVPGRTLVDVAKRTQAGVRTLAHSIGFEQVPAYSDQVVGDIVLSAPNTAAAAGRVDPLHVSPNVATDIETGRNTQFGAGVSAGPGVKIGPGVIVGGKDAKIAIQGSPGAPAKPMQEAAIPVDPALGVPPKGVAPIASFMRSNAGWTVTVSSAEPATSFSYRIDSTGEFRETGLLDVLDPRTGQRMPNPSFPLSGRAKATVIDVRYTRTDGSMAGPFPIRFDPDVALFDSQRRALQQIWPSWAEFRQFNGLMIYFTTLLSYRCAITEVRYGLDGSAPLSRFDLPPCNPDDPFSIPNNAKTFMKLPPSTKSISLQVTWRDGTRSDVDTIER